MPREEYRLLTSFLNSNMGKPVEDCECSGHPSTGCTDEKVEKSTQSSLKTDEVPFQR
jgi:hypothetical protein